SDLPRGGHRRHHPGESAPAGRHRRGRGGGGLGHFCRRGHHRCLPGPARPFGRHDPDQQSHRRMTAGRQTGGTTLCRFTKVMRGIHMRTALSIAGSDSSAGAGIQADLKTMTMNGVYGMTAITALTAQNTTGVTAISEVSPEFLAQQLDAVFTDIRPDAVKIGMVSSPALIEVIGERLRFYKAEHIVVDPVKVATSGSRIIRT